MQLSERLQQFIQQKNLISPKDRLWIACSGGPDSVALFHLLFEIRKEWKLHLGLLHFNHGLRHQKAIRDERFVQSLARKWKVPFHAGKARDSVLKKVPKTSIEEAARSARYDFFACWAAKKRGKIVLAHTRDDQAETVLMRVLQGTGLKGLAGIRTRLHMKKVQFIRPLLFCTKKDILNYLGNKKIRYCVDETNRSTRFLRNRIRLKLLPTIQTLVNPRADESLARLADNVQDEISLLEELEAKSWERVGKSFSKKKSYFGKKGFIKLPKAMQYRVMDRAAKMMDSRSGMNFESWKRLERGLKKSSYKQFLPRDILCEVSKHRIAFQKKVMRSRSKTLRNLESKIT